MKKVLPYLICLLGALTLYGCGKCDPLKFETQESAFEGTRRAYINMIRDGIADEEQEGYFYVHKVYSSDGDKAGLYVNGERYINDDGVYKSIILEMTGIPYSGKPGDTVFSFEGKIDLKFYDVDYEDVPVVLTGTVKKRVSTRCSPDGPERVFMVRFAVQLTLPVEGSEEPEIIKLEFDDYRR